MEISGTSNTDFVGTDVSPYVHIRDGVVTANREQGAGSREQELGFVILNKVTHSVLRKNLNLCQQEPYNLLCASFCSGWQLVQDERRVQSSVNGE